MSLADKVRRDYERRPYPHGNDKALRASSWSLSLEWIEAFTGVNVRGEAAVRVLFAGCGDGTEAFNLQRRLPRAEIVAVDFSKRSIAIALRLQRREPAMQGIRFLAADLTDPRLSGGLGGGFDLILCHGVLSYVPRYGLALGNFCRCLKPGGALYLGVNGAAHVSQRLRRALPMLGFDLNAFRDDPRVRRALRLCESVTTREGLPEVSGLHSGFLASDVFGALNTCLPLSGWVAAAGRAGLHLRADLPAIGLFRRIAESDSHSLLMPRSRGEAGLFAEELRPSQFLRLLFTRRREANPPWESPRRLAAWRIVPTGLYTLSLPRGKGRVRDRLRPVRITSEPFNLAMQWEMPEWEIELIRRGDGVCPVGRVLRAIPLAVPGSELTKQLYLLYQMGVVNLLPPGAAS